MQTNITNQTIKSAQPKEKAYEIRDTQLKGLILRVQPSGIMTYYLEYRRGKRVKIGRSPIITPVRARELAKDKLYKGEDHAKEKRLEKTYTFTEFLNLVYLPWAKSNLRRADASVARLKLITELKDLPLSEISPLLVEEWRSKRLDNGIKASTINRQLGGLRASLNRAVEWGLLGKNPLAIVRLCREDSNPKVRYLTKDEEQKLYDSLDKREARVREERRTYNLWLAERGHPLYPDLSSTAFADYLKPAVLLSLNTGLRRGELFGLKWDDVDFVHRILTVNAETAKAGKTRHIPLNDDALSVLEGWLAQSESKTGYVFTHNGKPFHDARKSWAGVLKDSDIKKFRWHDLRHTFASNLVMAGVDLNTVRELLGHSDYKMTLRYAHLAPEHKMAAVQKISLRLIPEVQDSEEKNTKKDGTIE